MTNKRNNWYLTFLQHFLATLPYGEIEFFIDSDEGRCSLEWFKGDYSYAADIGYAPEHNAARRGAFLANVVAGEYKAALEARVGGTKDEG
jgi:hypothetical protein